MVVRKQSVALDEAVLVAARKSAASANTSLSAWLNRAALRELTIERGLAAVTKWEAEHAPITALEARRADQALDRVLGGRARPRKHRQAR